MFPIAFRRGHSDITLGDIILSRKLVSLNPHYNPPFTHQVLNGMRVSK